MVDIVKGISSIFKSDKRGLGLPYPTWQMIGGMFVQMTDTGANYINKAYLANSYVRSMTEEIAGKASMAPGSVYRISNKSKAQKYRSSLKSGFTGQSFIKSMVLKAQAFTEVEDHEFTKLINDEPNTYQTGQQLKKELHGYKLVTGNSYMYASVVGGNYSAGFKPQRLWSIPSPCVQIVSGDNVNPVKGYKVSYFDNEDIDPKQVVHFKDLNLVSDVTGNQWLYGSSRLSSGRATVGGFQEAQQAQGTLFKNMGPLGIVSGSGENSSLDEEQAIAIQDKFEQRHTGMVNGGKLVVTPSDVKFTAIGISPVDLNIIQAKGDYLQELCALYHYPKEKLTGSQNTASQGLADKQVITSCVIPLLLEFDDTITAYIRKAYNDPSLVFISDLQVYKELEENMKDLAEWLSKAYWLTIDEKRAVMDYEPAPNGNVMLVPSGLVTLDDVLAKPEEVDLDLLDNNNAL